MLDKTASSTTYQGGEGQSVFPIPFPFLESSHIRAETRDADGVVSVLAAGVDYSVNLLSDQYGELVLLGEPLAASAMLVISRRIPLTQEIMFHNQGPNSPRATEEAVDKLTMIAQQLRDGIDGCLSLPDGVDADEVREILLNGNEELDEVRNRVGALDAKVSAKADREHTHDPSAISGLENSLAAKAGTEHTHAQSAISGLENSLAAKAGLEHTHAQSAISGLETGLMAKADREHTHVQSSISGLDDRLAGKANAAHAHSLGDVSGLAAALAGKADSDDPRFDRSGTPASHAASHFVSGADPVRPGDIGAQPVPPNDGKSYLAVAGGNGWVEYVAPSGGDGGGGTTDHAQLANRGVANQHPQAAITNLAEDLGAIRVELSRLGGASLPAGGGQNDILTRNAAGEAAWTDPAQAAERLPLMSHAGRGVAKLSSGRGLELDGDGRLGIASANLVAKSAVEENAARLAGIQAGLGAMSAAADAPANGRPHARQDGTWCEIAIPSGGGSGGGGIVGEIRLLPFRCGELPTGWHFCNGDRYTLSSAPGAALAALPATMRSDWGIVASDGTINLPNLFFNGDGCFLRPVDNAARFPGSSQSDAIRNITGSFSMSPTNSIVYVGTAYDSVLEGAFAAGTAYKNQGCSPYSAGFKTVGDLYFDASRSVPTASENRPLNIGMTPAIYLGV